MALVFDIETVGERWDTFDETTQSALTRWIKREAKSEEEYRVSLGDIKQGLGLSPLTGFIVVIGVYDTEKAKGVVYFSAPGEKFESCEESGITYKAMNEKEMLEHFWEGAKKYDEFVTYNGRGFDAPFIALRSMVRGVRPTRDLLEGRYLYQQRGCKHIDLQEQLTFYGAWNKKPSLHLFCRALGIESPKALGTTGDDVAALYADKKYLDIARYNAGDLRATAALYKRWQEAFR